ncbi:MAG: TonB-dependent receptor [Candidatus Marinimicrobia bacterium]|nr:TonB-dependent receptor [Candidatus Neomarinimicrobiota bacterium]
MNYLNIITGVIITLVPIFSNAQISSEISGSVRNAIDNKPIFGANVLIEGTTFGAATNESGQFIIRGVPAGEFTISAGVIGYDVRKQKITVGQTALSVLFSLYPRILEGENVVVSATRAISGKTPVAFSNVDSRTLTEKYSSQELPMLLDEIPSLYSYSMTGSGMGYTEIKIRGFDATRVAVTLNGVPLNDPEDHVTYFYDIADLSANIQDVQVQRGVGNSLYGTAAIGGSINILTKGAGTEPGITLSGTSGSYNTRRLNFSFGTGYIENKYSAYGRFSKLRTDGYRTDSGVDSWSYFLSGSRYDRDMTTTFNVFGGPLVAKFAWFGIGKDLLDDDDLRRSNFYSPSEENEFFDEQVDDFLQSHYQLINDWRINEQIRFENTFFHVKGDGFFQDYKSDRNPVEYNLVGVETTDLVRKKNVDKSQWGWLPRFTFTKAGWSLALGAEFSFYNAKHWGEVIWVKENNQTPPNNKYYGYETGKQSSTIYTHVVYGIDENTDLMFDVQYQHIGYDFDQNPIGAFKNDYEYSVNYNFLTPRMGINRRLNSSITAFVNFSVANREPRDADIYDADDPYAVPRFELNPDGTPNFSKPLIGQETLYDYELGGAWRNSNAFLKLNLFYMDFRDEIVPTGQVDDIGLRLYYNAVKSIHRGIEADASWSLTNGAYISGNFSLNDNYFVSYNEPGYDIEGKLFPIDRSGNKISGFPDYLAGIKVGYRGSTISSFLYTRFVGGQFLDNSGTADLSINAHRIVNFFLSYDYNNAGNAIPIRIQLNVNNILDTKYETSGYVYYYQGFIPEYIPAALRNAYITVTLKF